MPKATTKELLNLFESASRSADDSDIAKDVHAYFQHCETVASVLGIDIYKYSQFAQPQQRLVPVVFQNLYDETVADCLDTETAVFNAENFEGRFIPTGDGGFNIFETPLQALIFAAYFQANVSAYNASLWRPSLRQFVGPLTLRYAVTRDAVFQLDANWFGSAIINNARILSRDALNRCLVDGPSVAWFDERIGTVESLQLVRRSTLAILSARSDDKQAMSIVFPRRADNDPQQNAFRELTIQKIGTVVAKATSLDIYSLYAQVMMAWTHGGDNRGLMITLGNLNSAGIS